MDGNILILDSERGVRNLHMKDKEHSHVRAREAGDFLSFIHNELRPQFSPLPH